jgi:hypothetical protein
MQVVILLSSAMPYAYVAGGVNTNWLGGQSATSNTQLSFVHLVMPSLGLEGESKEYESSLAKDIIALA